MSRGKRVELMLKKGGVGVNEESTSGPRICYYPRVRDVGKIKTKGDAVYTKKVASSIYGVGRSIHFSRIESFPNRKLENFNDAYSLNLILLPSVSPDFPCLLIRLWANCPMFL